MRARQSLHRIPQPPLTDFAHDAHDHELARRANRLHANSATAAPNAAATGDASSAILGTYKRQAPLFVRGEGVYMYDADGKRYLDFVAGIAVTALGHGDAGVMQAMQEAMSTGTDSHVESLPHGTG
jgi:4-aminobutyrate aminotransferase-like enzyme